MSGRKYQYSIRDAMDAAAAICGIDGWQGYQWQAHDGGCLVSGCVPSGVYTKGKNKGHPKFRPAMPGTDRKVVVADSHMQEVAHAYELNCGLCWDCKGEGKTWAGWSADTGHKHRECVRCIGSGKAAQT